MCRLSPMLITALTMLASSASVVRSRTNACWSTWMGTLRAWRILAAASAASCGSATYGNRMMTRRSAEPRELDRGALQPVAHVQLAEQAERDGEQGGCPRGIPRPPRQRGQSEMAE